MPETLVRDRFPAALFMQSFETIKLLPISILLDIDSARF
jgi:hypothetical protein